MKTYGKLTSGEAYRIEIPISVGLAIPDTYILQFEYLKEISMHIAYQGSLITDKVGKAKIRDNTIKSQVRINVNENIVYAHGAQYLYIEYRLL